MSIDSNLIRSRDLAKRLGCNVDTINRMARTGRALRAARFRRGWWKLGSLVVAGILRLT